MTIDAGAGGGEGEGGGRLLVYPAVRRPKRPPNCKNVTPAAAL